MLTTEQIKELQDKYLDKRIQIGDRVGICTFIGYNPFFPEWELQITLNRTPIINVDYKQIQLMQS